MMGIYKTHSVVCSNQCNSLTQNPELFSSILQSCVKSKDSEGAQILHSIITMGCGYECTPKIVCQFITSYASCGLIVDAHRTFQVQGLSDHSLNPHIWNTIISAYAEHGESEQAISLYEQSRRRNVSSNPSTFVALFKACARSDRLSEARLLHSDLEKDGLEIDLRTGNTLVDMYSKCNSLHDARRVFDHLRTRNIVSWNTMLTGYIQHGLNGDALEMVEKMYEQRLVPSNITLICQLKLYTSMKDLNQGQAIHVQVYKLGIESDMVLGNSLLNMYVKCNELEAANLVFDRLQTQNVVAWSGMIQGYAENGHGEEAIKLFIKMWKRGINPDEIMFVCILKACASIRALEQGNLIYIEVLKQNITLNVFIGSILVVMYTKCGRIPDARRVFDKLPARNVVSWSSMIEAYAEEGQGEEALKLFKGMHEQNAKPNRITFLCVIKACSSISALELGMCVHGCAIEHSFESDLLIGNILVDMYAKCGSLSDAVSLFNMLDSGSLESLSALISGYANHGHLEMAKHYFQKLWNEGIEYDIIAFLSLIYACSHSGLLQEGCFYFRCMMEEFALLPTMEHYACVIDMFGRAGLLNEAEDVIDKMPFAPDSVVWKALLSSCVRHTNVNVGMRAFNALLKFDCEHAAGYVLMSNIHVATTILSEDA